MNCPPIISTALQKTSNKLTEDVKEILAIKYSAPKIVELKGNDLVACFITVFGKIQINTGWVIQPIVNDNKQLTIYGTALIEEMLHCIAINYQNYNANDIIHALRKHSSKVKDWGKSFNINLLKEVLDEYEKCDRQPAIEEETKLLDYTGTINKLTKEEVQNSTRKDVQDMYELYLNKDILPSTSLTAHISFDCLFEDNQITEKWMNLFYARGFVAYKQFLLNINCENESQKAEINRTLSIMSNIENKVKSFALDSVFIEAKKAGKESFYKNEKSE